MKKRHQDRQTEGLILINSLDEIPEFATEHEEWEWWETHEYSDSLWDSSPMTKNDLSGLVLTKRKPKVEVRSWGEVPDFASEDEERAWWENREPTWELLQTLPDRKIMPTRPGAIYCSYKT